MDDSYALLNLKPTASLSEVKKAYRSLLKRYHPDLNPNIHDSEIIYKIIAAYESIINDSTNLDNIPSGKSFLNFINTYFPNDCANLDSNLTPYNIFELFIIIFFKSLKSTSLSLKDYNTYLSLFQLFIFTFFLTLFLLFQYSLLLIPLFILFLDIFSRSLDKLLHFDKINNLNKLIYKDIYNFILVFNSCSHSNLKDLSDKINKSLLIRSKLIKYRGIFNILSELLGL